MAWLHLEGHDEIVAQFRRALAENRLASTFLFVGAEGIGKRAFALRLAQSLLCQIRDEKLLDPCGRCPGCVQALAGTHPDLIQVSLPPGKSFIPVAILKGDDDEPDYPVPRSLLFNLALRPFYGGRKVAIVDDADDLNLEGANCLLKTLEEPPPRSVLILISTSVDRQLPTIRSRAQIVRFRPLEAAVVARLLVEQGRVSDFEEARRLAAQSGGSLSKAVEMADPQLWQFRRELLNLLSQSPLPSISLAQAVIKFVDEAGKEAAARRDRLRLVIGFVADFFRHVMRQLAGMETDADAELAAAIGRAAFAAAWDLESAGEAAQRSLEALAQLDRNANLHTLVEAWLDDVLLLNRRLLA